VEAPQTSNCSLRTGRLAAGVARRFPAAGARV